MTDTSTGFEKYLTSAVVADFSGSGSQTLLEALQTPEISEETANDITSSIFTEILMSVSEGVLTVDDVAGFMQQAISDESKAIIFCQVFDVFPQDEAIGALVTQLHKDGGIIKASTLAQFVDSDTLIRLNIVPAQSLNRQMNTRKRDEFFTQKKFNLLHEEYEGYSILVSEFYAIFNNEENLFLVDHAIKVVYSLIGHYLLDPNRVLDILIDISSVYIVGNHQFVMQFFKKSPWWPLVEANCNDLSSLNIGGNPAVVNSISLRLLKQAPDRDIPETFRILISLFIREGFISFGSIYPFLSPSDEDMHKLEDIYKKELEKKVLHSNASALALAAPLIEEEAEGSGGINASTVSSSPEKTVESMKCFNMKFQMLKCFLSNGLYWPAIYILSQYPFLANIDSEISELMHRVLAAIIDPLYSKISPLTHSNLKVFQETKLLVTPQSMNKVRLEESPVSQKYCFNPTALIQGKEAVYFDPEWSNGLPILGSAKDLIPVSRQFLKFMSSILSQNQANFIKLCEIIVTDLKNDSSIEQRGIWLNYFRNFILPCIGLVTENAIPVDKAYEILSFFPVDDRFNLYGELYQVTAKTNPHVKIAYGKAEKATKDVLKRLSKENVEPMKRRLAKISLSNPLPCFLTILQQLESYDNLNTLVVETAAYFNDYGWDNLTLAIMMRLTSAGRSNKQANGLNERQWIQSLSSFIGKIFQKYPKSGDLNTLIRYLLSSLHSSGSVDLIVFKEILSSMGGIQSISNLTQLQIEVINCKPSMQKVVYKTIGDKRFDMFPSGSELRHALMKDKSINEFLILLCKINREAIDASDISHLKVLASVRDEIDSVLHLLCTLSGFFGKDTSALLQIDDLIGNYNVPITWAFEFWREFILDINLGDLQKQVESALPQEFFKQINSTLFVLFWKLRLYDLNYSSALYDNELAKLRSKYSSLIEEYAFARRDRNAPSGSFKPLRNLISDTDALIVKIPSEKEHHEKHSKIINETLIDTLNSSLSQFGADDAKGFLQSCVLPRAVHSSFDAIYCAQFIFKLHKLGISQYSLIAMLDCLFRNNIFFSTLFTCTPVEAENLGMFVSAILKELNAWTKEDIFNKNTVDKSLIKASDADVMTFGEFRKSVFEYHTLLLSDVSRALEVTTYMSRMNAITYLKNLLGVYPIVEDHCESVIELITKITENEKRDDLKLSSSALIGHVKSRKRYWVHLWDFIDMEDDAKAVQIQKRKEIEERAAKKLKEEELKKLELQRQEDRKQQNEERERQEAEMTKAQSDVAVKSSISYDDRAKPSSRVTSRNSEAAKGRYDNYSQTTSTVEKKIPDKPSEHFGRYNSPRARTGADSYQKSSTPTGPSGPKAFNDITQANAKSRDVSSRDVPSDDLFRGRSDQKLTKGSETPAGNSQLKSRLEMARQERSLRNDHVNRDIAYSRNGRSETLASPSHSATKVIPERSHTAPLSSSSSAQSSSQKNSETRSSLPQVPRTNTPTAPSSSSSVKPGNAEKASTKESLSSQAPRARTPTGPSSTSSVNQESVGKSGGRVPLPPQAPPRDRISLSNTSTNERVPLPPQSAIRNSTQTPSQTTVRSRVALPPQQPPRERQPLAPSQASRGYRTSFGKDDRSTNNRSTTQVRRSSGDPLPPPSLPPPGQKVFRKEGDLRDNRNNHNTHDTGDSRNSRENRDDRDNRDRKRKWGGKGRESDKRHRY